MAVAWEISGRKRKKKQGFLFFVCLLGAWIVW